MNDEALAREFLSEPSRNQTTCMNDETALAPLDDSIIEKLALNSDVSGLKPAEKVAYYRALCARVGCDPATQPFKLLRLSGREQFYCDRGGCAQLRRLHGVSTRIINREVVNECYVVTAQASANGRQEESIGAVPIGVAKGETLCNLYMKSETKAKRRATLDLLGLGMLDETEVATIPGAETVELPPAANAEQNPPAQAAPAPQKPASAPPASTARHLTPPSNRTRAWALEQLKALAEGENSENRVIVTRFLFNAGVLAADKEPENWPLRWVPSSKEQLKALFTAIADFDSGSPAQMPYPAHAMPAEVQTGTVSGPCEAPRSEPGDTLADQPATQNWRTYILKWGQHKGMKLADLPHDVQYGWFTGFHLSDTNTIKDEFGNLVPKPKPESAKAKDKALRAALDAMGKEKGWGEQIQPVKAPDEPA